jgi:hypothetical protein
VRGQPVVWLRGGSPASETVFATALRSCCRPPGRGQPRTSQEDMVAASMATTPPSTRCLTNPAPAAASAFAMMLRLAASAFASASASASAFASAFASSAGPARCRPRGARPMIDLPLSRQYERVAPTPQKNTKRLALCVRAIARNLLPPSPIGSASITQGLAGGLTETCLSVRRMHVRAPQHH